MPCTSAVCATSSTAMTPLSPETSSPGAVLRERTRKLAVHEFGHTLGLDHCEVFGCVMSDAQGKLIRSLDASGETYCGKCRKQLPTEWLTPK